MNYAAAYVKDRERSRAYGDEEIKKLIEDAEQAGSLEMTNAMLLSAISKILYNLARIKR